MSFNISFLILCFIEIQSLYSVEHSITLIEQAYISAKTSQYFYLIYDSSSPMMECTTGFMFSLVYNVIKTSIQSQTQYSCRLQTSISTLLALWLLLRSVAIVVHDNVQGDSNETVDNVEGDGISNSNFLFYFSFHLLPTLN